MALLDILKGHPSLTDVEKARARAQRELTVARAAVHEAGVAYETALEDGASDDDMRAALDKKTTTSWAVARLTKRIAELDKQHAELTAKARADRLHDLDQRTIELCDAIGPAWQKLNDQLVQLVKLRGDYETAGLRRELCEIEMFPRSVVDVSDRMSADPQMGRHELLDRWVYTNSQFKQRISANRRIPA